jgi:DNA-binding GntR family transcriptional regulator
MADMTPERLDKERPTRPVAARTAVPESGPVVGCGALNEMVDNLGVAPLRTEDRLREAIVTGSLQPNERLVESDLAGRLGVSRTLIRAALVRLEHEGLVEHERHRGARVRLVSEHEAVEILETRAVLEGLAARLAAERANAEDVDDLKGVLADMQELREADDLLAVSDLNAQLHRRLLEISAHETATRLIGALNSQMVRFQYRTILLPGRSERSFAEHAEIVAAIATHDGERAEAAMRAHLSSVADALRREAPPSTGQ